MLSDYVRKLRQHVGHDLIWLPAVTAIITRDDGKFLAMRHVNLGRWVFPGGAVEFDETLHQALAREVREETGLDVSVGELLDTQVGPEHVIHYPNGDRVAYMTAFYHCRDTGAKEPARTEEAVDIGYFTLDEIEMLDLMPWMHAILPLVRKKLGR